MTPRAKDRNESGRRVLSVDGKFVISGWVEQIRRYMENNVSQVSQLTKGNTSMERNYVCMCVCIYIHINYVLCNCIHIYILSLIYEEVTFL